MSDSILNIIINTVKRGGGDKEAVKGIVDLKTKVKELTGVNLSSITAYSAAAVAAGTLVKVTKYAVDQAKEAELVTAKVNAVIKSTQGVAGMTADAVDNLASKLSMMSGVDDDVIANGEALMLTFTQISSKVFPEAMAAALDMSSSLEKDLGSSVTLVSKLLNVQAGDVGQVSTAMSAAKKVGVSFTQTQIDMAKRAIAAGDVLTYQKIILGELKTEYGGAAAAAGNTYAGSMNKLKVAVDNLAESVGGKLTPTLTDLNIVAAHLVNQTNELEMKNRGFNEALLLLLSGPLYPLVKYYEQLAKGLSDWADKIEGTTDTVGIADQKYWEHRGYVEEVGAAYESAGQKITPVTSYFKELTKEMIFNHIAANLNYEDSLNLARQMGLVNENTYRALTTIDQLTDTYGRNADGTINLTGRTNEFWDAISKVTATAGTYAWNFVVNSSSPGFNMGPGSYQEALQQGLINGSSGGSSGGSGWELKGTKGGAGTDKAWFNGSSWYYGDKPPGAATGGMVKVGEQGTEIVKLPDGAFVYNHEQTQQMLGGGVSNITFNISGAGDPKRVADEVVRRLNIQSVGRFK